VSNAGFMTLGPVASFDPDEGARMIAVNFATPVRLARAIVPKMIARGHGVFVNVTSVAAFVTLPGWAYQAASKAASATFSEALHDEIAGTGAHVLTAYPGPTDTPMTRAGLAAYGESGLVARLPLGRPDAFARRLRLAIERRRRRLVYPRFYGVARLFPRISRWVSWRVAPRLNPPA
jgi:short-subunit dehydrogenase